MIEKSDLLNMNNPLESIDEISLEDFLSTYHTRILQDSEKLFVIDFLYPLLGPANIKYIIPQYPFIDSEGRSRRIDFALIYNNIKIALEVNGETYHAEGIIPNEMFDDNLNRQNEILNAGWFLLRFSYSQLQSPSWRERVNSALFYLIRRKVPELISENIIEPNHLQKVVLDALHYYRSKNWKKGIVVLPTGTGKTFLSAFDSLNANGRILFIVHRLDILNQSKEAFEKIYPNDKLGLLTGEVKENIKDSKILFASKDSLRNPDVLSILPQNEFDYIVVDEVHHGQAPTYQAILQYFKPNYFMLGLTATPDRMDRKDIFELFDYQKIFEYTLNEAIENGFLVPYTYYGLKDNIDYSNIRYNGTKYNISDLDKTLIINERNERIFLEYLEKGNGNKAIGFCCSIKHAEALASFFNKKGIPSISITSNTENREQLVKDFRDNKYNIAFTVDIFNEGVDFPDVRVLLFLRPTESKTIFFQQLGRGLRLCGSKDNVVIIDFIGNYKKANNIRKYLAKNSKHIKNEKNGRFEKIQYEYSPNCDVIFEAEVEEILDRQDYSEIEISKEDLIDAYYNVSENLKRKPTQEDINTVGEFKINHYYRLFGSWVNFLKEIGEHTEFSYHFPQGTHLGHIMYIIYTVGSNNIKYSNISPEYVRFSGGYDSSDIAKFQRQTKYKLQAAMELGLLVDYRKEALEENFALVLTNEGKEIFTALLPLLKKIDFTFNEESKAVKSWGMKCESTINNSIRDYIDKNIKAKVITRQLFLQMDAVNLLLKYLYSIQRKKVIYKTEIYSDFFDAPFVKSFLDKHGLENPTEEVIRRRVPFLLNILDALGIIHQRTSEIETLFFIPTIKILRFNINEDEGLIIDRINRLKSFYSNFITDKKLEESNKAAESSSSKNYNQTPLEESYFSSEEISIFKETFGKDFFSESYYLPIGDI